MRAVVSTETATGTVTEISDEDITAGETAYKLAEGIFGTIELGEDYTFLLDAAGKVAGINTETTAKNYAYFTAIAQKKGIDGKVQMRIFTKDSEMKIMDVKDPVMFNGTPTPAAELLTKTELVQGGDPIGQLVILEMSGEEISGLETARDAMFMSEAERLAKFSYDFSTGSDGGKTRFEGNGVNILGSLYFVPQNIVLFLVPDAYSAKESDYSVRSFGSFKHGDRYYDTVCYDIDENHVISAMVQTVASTVEISDTGSTGVVTGFGTALNEDGETVRTVTVKNRNETRLVFPSDAFQITLGTTALTDANKGETQVTQNTMGVKTVKETMQPAALNVGDVVMYTLKGGTDVLSSMRVLCRAGYAAPAEKSLEGAGEFYNYSQLTRAFGQVQSVLEQGITLTPGQYKRMYAFQGNGEQAPVLLVENGEVELVTPQHIRVGDMVYVQKHNCYQTITVIYR